MISDASYSRELVDRVMLSLIGRAPWSARFEEAMRELVVLEQYTPPYLADYLTEFKDAVAAYKKAPTNGTADRVTMAIRQLDMALPR
jgi:hypothetical protein